MFPRPQPPDRDADLAWDAFRYAADELTPGEVAAFEHRLGHDQAAREAVAAAVDRLGALALVVDERATVGVAPAPSRVRSRSSRRVGRGLAAGAAAAAVLAAGWWGTNARPGPARVAIPVAHDDPADAAGLDGPELVADGEPAPVDLEEVDVPAERPLPSWLTAAFASEPAAEPAAEVSTWEGN